MKLEYVPTADDVFALHVALHARHSRHPLVRMCVAGALCVAAGGAMMAVIGSPMWSVLPLAALVGVGTLWATFRKVAPVRARVEHDIALSAWGRIPYRLDVDADGVRYERGPFRSRAAWSAFERLLETDDLLILLERRGPGALAYGLAKRELDRAGGSAAWRGFIAGQLKERSPPRP
jgi:hypothetical protein